MKQEIEKEAREFVNRTTIYGAEKAPIGSGARSYFETELSCFIAGVNSKCSERIKIEFAIDIIDKIISMYVPDGNPEILLNKIKQLQNQLKNER